MTEPRALPENRALDTLAAAQAVSSALLSLLLLLTPGAASAGGGPETTLLVVNADSPLSLRIANEYVQLRDIPQTHVVWLQGVPSTDSVPIARFRDRIWQPISEFMRVNKLDREIDAIVYSADFPYGVNFSADLKAAKGLKSRYLGRIASLTSITYFARRVELQDIGYLGKNHYFRDFAGPRKKRVKAVASSPGLTEKQIKSLRNDAGVALRRKEYESAIENYRKLLASHPQSPQNWHDLARGLAAAGKNTQAMAALVNAVDSGWTNSLETRSDPYLKALRNRPGFAELIRRMETAFQPIQLPHGFSSRYVWSNADLAFWDEDDSRDQYYLSTLLAYTGIRGNSFPEVMNYLRASAASDGSRPDGTVYLMENANVRSRTRQNLFPTTLDELARRGRPGKILNKRIPGQNGVIPVGKMDVIGLVAGSPVFDWEPAQSRLLPGAIAESLTSFGGDFNRAKQTKLTEFLRQGAAGSSGAVAEPYSFQEKFPVPLLHSYYADGCSLAEAFYQSIEYPYQLVVVGDPLARPFARFAEIDLESPDPEQPWSGTVYTKPVVQVPDGGAIREVELWLDGRRLSTAAPGEKIPLNTEVLADGTHQLRLVAVEDSSVETRSYAQFDIRVMNGKADIRIDDIDPRVTYGEEINISGSAPIGSRLALFQGHRTLGSATSENGKWSLIVPSTKLGLGPVSLRVEASRSDGLRFRSAEIELTITEPQRRPAYRDAPPLNKGLRAVIYDTKGTEHRITIEQLKGAIKFPDKKRIRIGRLSLSGFFNVAAAGFYQLVLKTSGHIRLSINDQLVLDKRIDERDAETYLPLSLEAGWHRLQIDLDDPRRSHLKIVLAGDQIPELLGGDNLGY